MTDFSSLTTQATAVLDGFEATLRSIADADLHRADPDGGWTVAQIVSHTHLSGLLFLADLQRLGHHQHLFMFREELGHDVIGAPPPSAAEAADRIASLRQALADCLPTFEAPLLERTVDVPPFGTMPMSVLAPGIVGHLAAHAEQAKGILKKRAAVTG